MSTKNPKNLARNAKISSVATHAANDTTKSTHSAGSAGSVRDAKTIITGPTILTLVRMGLAVIFFIFVLIPTLPTRLLALITFVAGAITDRIDGKWARKSQKVTDLGAFLDPLADKMLTSLALLALVDLDIVPVWVLAAILVRDFAVDGMRMMAARSGITIAASKYGKWKTALQLTALIIFLVKLVLDQLLLLTNCPFFNWPFLTVVGNIVLYISLALTLFSGADYLVKNWHRVIK